LEIPDDPCHPLGLLSVRYQMDPLGSLGRYPRLALALELWLLAGDFNLQIRRKQE
jgi:hypothetical protein